MKRRTFLAASGAMALGALGCPTLESEAVQLGPNSSSDLARLFQQAGSIDHKTAFEAQGKIAVALRTPVRNAIFQGMRDNDIPYRTRNAISPRQDIRSIMRFSVGDQMQMDLKHFRDCRYDIFAQGIESCVSRLVADIPKVGNNTSILVYHTDVFSDVHIFRHEKGGFVMFMDYHLMETTSGIVTGWNTNKDC